MEPNGILDHRQAGRGNSPARRRGSGAAVGFLADESGAIAATYALALFALVAAAGVAWDWTRMTALDSELQAAADQAALAAATQLDGQTDAIARATAAASNLVSNRTLMSNDGDGAALTVASIEFFAGYNQATDAFGAATTSDLSARTVRITIAPREAEYVMTPVIAVFRSGDITAQAAASLGSVICNTPPVMICNPREDDGEDFDPADFIGHGLKLITDDSGAPGNFGFLANGLGTGTQNLAEALGHDNQPGNCVATNGVTTEPGLKDVVFNAINTRFDLDINGANTCPGGDANCSAAPNVRKDLVKNSLAAAQCGVAGNSSWQQAAIGTRYVPPTNRLLDATERSAVKVMGLPRDLCHAWSNAGNCATDPAASYDKYGIIGSSNWDRDAYFQVNFGWGPGTWQSNSGLPSDVSRYKVYEWEAARALSDPERIQTDGSKFGSATPICRATGDLARRKITAAVINCRAQGVAGRKENVQVAHWVELLLVEPSITRRVSDSSSNLLTDANDVYVEVIRSVDVGDDGDEGEVIRRDVPYLIR